jgi:hypothetical protein
MKFASIMCSIPSLAVNSVSSVKRHTRREFEAYWQFISKKGPYDRFDIRSNQVRGPERRLLHFLSELVRQQSLPDVSIIYYQQDCLEKLGLKTRLQSLLHPAIPIFVSAKKDYQRNQVLFCDWHYDPKCNLPGAWNGMVKSLLTPSEVTCWYRKKDKLIWRGGPNDGLYSPDSIRHFPRGRLVSLTRQYPELIDASFNNYPPNFIKHRDFFEQHYPTRFLTTDEMAGYKYQIDIDGVTATFTGLAWKLLCGSVVFKQESANKTWFHDLLVPWEHYIPLRNDLGDLLQKLNWARANDEGCQTIAANGRQLIIKNALPNSLMSYCAAVLKQYASLISD